eukprot:3207226-Amphidinium_carterae.1
MTKVVGGFSSAGATLTVKTLLQGFGCRPFGHPLRWMQTSFGVPVAEAKIKHFLSSAGKFDITM